MTKRDESEQIIMKHVLWSMGGGLIPIPLFDVAAVTAVQLDMLKSLASLYGVDYSKENGKAFAGALTGSSFARLGASAMKVIPGIGWVVGGFSMSVMSGASTYAVGKIATSILESGRELSPGEAEAAKAGYQSWFEKGKGFVSDLENARVTSPDVFQTLEKLKGLLDSGVITDGEFQTKKQKLLSHI